MAQSVQNPRHIRIPRLLRDTAIALVLVLALLVCLELALSVAGIHPALRDDPFVGFTSWAPLYVPDPNDDTSVVTAENKRDLFNVQRFSEAKPRNTYRVFCLGGSTTYGRPFDDRTAFTSWLRLILPMLDPTREWEVINAGGISYASYRVVRLMNELANYDPDLFIVYNGHNEFLEKRTYRDIYATPGVLRELGGAIASTRIYATVRRIRQRLLDNAGVGERDMLPEEVTAILDESVGPDAYHRDDALRQNVIEHFRINIQRMIEIARSAKARIVFVTPASNIRDFSPFKSEHRENLTSDEHELFTATLARGQNALAENDIVGAIEAFQSCVDLDPRHAHAHYLLGQAYWRSERYDEAREAFERARDEDVCPLRALTPMSEVIRSTANDLGVPIVDFDSHVLAAAPHRAPGNEQFLDHVHPTVAVHGQLARLIVSTMAGEGWLPANAWNDSALTEAQAQIESSIDDGMRALSLRNLAKVLGWAGKFDEAYRSACDAAELAPQDAESQYAVAVAAENIGLNEERLARLRKTLAIQPSHPGALLRLGNALSAQSQTHEAAECYRKLAESGADTAYLGYNNLANELAAQGGYDEAIAHYEAALAFRPSYTEARGNLALALAHVGRVDDALHQYELALKSDPESAVIHYNFGALLLKKKSPSEALRHLEIAARLMPDYPPAHYHLALAYEQTHNRAKARAHLKQALQLEPRYDDALRARERIEKAD